MLAVFLVSTLLSGGALAGAGMAVGAFMGRIILHINAAVFVTCMTILGLGFEAGGPGECGGAFGGTITIVPLDPPIIPADRASETAKRLIAKNNELFKRLS